MLPSKARRRVRCCCSAPPRAPRATGRRCGTARTSTAGRPGCRRPSPTSEVPGLARDAGRQLHRADRIGPRSAEGLHRRRRVDGRPAIRISGEVFGELRNKDSFKDYHLRLQFKWGEKKWPPRDGPETPRDSGLLYHVHAAPGVDGRTWARSIELQIQEHDVGDLYAVGSAIAVRAKARRGHAAAALRLRSDRRVDVLLAEPGLVGPLHQAAGQREADRRVEHRRAGLPSRRLHPHRQRQGRDAAARRQCGSTAICRRRSPPGRSSCSPKGPRSSTATSRSVRSRRSPPEFAAK